MNLSPLHTRASWLLASLLLVLAGCGSVAKHDDGGNNTHKPGATSFESDLPSQNGGNGGKNSGEAAPSAGADDSTTHGDSSGGAERAIVEADILQVSGNRLYTLSRAAGLSIIDLSNPAKLKMLGTARHLAAEPFEMYLRDSVALVLLSSWGEYVEVDDGYQWVEVSKVVALDVANPADIKTLGTFDVPGEISDSRIVGDVLYVVGYQNGYCWGCENNKPLTSIVSLSVKDPHKMSKVDELQYPDDNNTWGWSRRSITVTTDRMYVAGPEYGQNDVVGSTIQVVDISDPAGKLVEGAKVLAEGMVSSRWQMDEYQGVLRVISQAGAWNPTQPPVVQTFTVTSAKEVTALGRMELTLPANELLQSVRFDGLKGYAITAVQTDPLFTIDLSTPAAPKQLGELQMPGTLYYMEPRGDRLIGLGFDQGNAAGGVTVSIFDVKDLSNPKMLDRVNFGGTWANLPEDQDRIHKAFKILDDLGLMLVPFSGWDPGAEDCWNNYNSGVQLVDFAGDNLTLRAMLPSEGEARRAFVHAGTLYSISDEHVQGYDITNRAAPKPKGGLVLARNVTDALPLSNGVVARITQDWWSSQNMFVEFTSSAKVENASENLSEFDLARVIAPAACNSYTWIANAFTHGTQLEVVYQRYSYNSNWDNSKTLVGVAVIDAKDPAQPKLLGKNEWDTGNSWYWWSSYYYYGYYGGQTNMVRTNNTITMLEGSWDSNAQQYSLRARVMDMTDPAQILTATVDLPDHDGYSGLIVEGDTVLTSHFETSSEGKARFYVDRLDVSDAAHPKFAEALNVPGSLLHFDTAHQRLITQELRRVEVDDITGDECYERFVNASFDGDWQKPGKCTGFIERLHLLHLEDALAVLDDSYELGEKRMLSSTSLGDDRLFAITGPNYYYYGGVADCADCGGGYYAGNVTQPVELLVLGGLNEGQFEIGKLSVKQSDPWWGFWGTPPVSAGGKRALLVSYNQAAVVDASDATKPTIVKKQDLYGWLQSVRMDGDSALLSLSTAGVQRLDMLK